MRTLLGAVLLAAAVSTAAPCFAQVGGIPSEILSARQALTPDQKKTLVTVLDEYAGRMAQGDPAAVVETRNRLVELMRNPLAAEIFRREASVELVKQFEPLCKGKDAFRATNAFIVARFLGTAESVDFLIDNIGPDAQPDVALRIAASAQLSKGLALAPLSPPQLDALAKRIANACGAETNWMVVSQNIEAIASMLRQKNIPSAQAEAIALSEGSAINDIAERALKAGGGDMVQALQRALLVVRNQAELPDSTRSKLLEKIGPTLEKIAAAKATPPAEFAARPELANAFKGVTNTAEILQKQRGASATAAGG